MTAKLSNPYTIVSALLAKTGGPFGTGHALPQFTVKPLTGGNTADLVGVVTWTHTAVVKAANDDKVLDEAQRMLETAHDLRLPEALRKSVPKLLATGTSPASILMEHFDEKDGYISLQDRAFPVNGRSPDSLTELQRGVFCVLDLFFHGYKASANHRLMPNQWADGVDRIAERMASANAVDERFDMELPLWVNGAPLTSLADMLRTMDKYRAVLGTWSARFVTWVHGDPNMGNIIVRFDPGTVEVKLIDPKAWGTGDWVFDMAKMVHHLGVTLPVERPLPGAVRPAASFARRDGIAVIDHQFEVPMDIDVLMQGILDRAESFAQSMGDSHWRARFDLYMASCLLGVVVGRLGSGRAPNVDAALILYAEGMRWLQKVIDRLPVDAPPAMPGGLATGLEATDLPDPVPATLAQARAKVLALVPGATQALDRRGFQLVTWSPPRPNSRNKDAEISLEHEARLAPRDPASLSALRGALQVAATGGAAQAQLLPGDARFGSLRVLRHARAAGAQSVDHYYEASAASPSGNLIPRMLTLRERVAAKGGFMTWGQSDDATKRPLNLELPAVVLDADAGVLARLEFNWIDVPALALADANDAQRPDECRARNPVFLANHIVPFDLGALQAVLEHTTFREKYSLFDGDTEVFHLNIDTVVAQALSSMRLASYVDVDIAPLGVVDRDGLARLIAFSRALMQRYRLQPVPMTKALRSAHATHLQRE